MCRKYYKIYKFHVIVKNSFEWLIKYGINDSIANKEFVYETINKRGDSEWSVSIILYGHEELSGISKMHEDGKSFPFIYFYRQTRIRQEASCNHICDDTAV